MKRKIIQITVLPDRSGHYVMIAVCDDGSAWLMRLDDKAQWLPIPPIPQGESAQIETPEPSEDLLKLGLDQLELNVRTSNTLHNMGLRTIGDLVKVTEEDLLAQQNFGRKSLYELREILWNIGIELKAKKA